MLKRTKVIISSMVALLSIALISLGLILFVKDKEGDPTPTPVNVQYTESSLNEFTTAVAKMVNFNLNYNPTTDKMGNVLNMLGEESIAALGLAFQDANIEQAKFNKVIAGLHDSLEYIELSEIDLEDYFSMEALSATDGVAEAFGYIFDSIKKIRNGLDAGQITDGEHEAIEAGELKKIVDSLVSAGLTGEELGRVLYHFLDNLFDTVLAHKTQINDGLKYYLDAIDKDINIARLTGEDKLSYQYFQVMVLSASFVPSLVTPAQKALHDAGEEKFTNEIAVMFSGLENIMNIGESVSSGKIQTFLQTIKDVDLNDTSSLNGAVNLLTQTMSGYAQTLRDTKTTGINSLGVERTGTLIVSESLMNVLMSLENKIVPIAHLFLSLGESKVNPVLFMGSTILETASVVVNGVVDSVINVFDLLSSPDMAEYLVKILVEKDKYFSNFKFALTTQEEVYDALTSEKVKSLEIYPSIVEEIYLVTKINITSLDFKATDLTVEKSTLNGEDYMSVLDAVRLILVNQADMGLISSAQEINIDVNSYQTKEYLSADSSYEGPRLVVFKRGSEGDYPLGQNDIEKLLNNIALDMTISDALNQTNEDEVLFLMKLATAFLGENGDNITINDEFFFVLAETGISETLLTEAVEILVDGFINLELFGMKDYVGQAKLASYWGDKYSEEENGYLSWSSDVTDEDRVWIMYYDSAAGLYKRISKTPFNIFDKQNVPADLLTPFYDYTFYNDLFPIATGLDNSDGLYVNEVLLLLRSATAIGLLEFPYNSYNNEYDNWNRGAFAKVLEFIVRQPSISLDNVLIDGNGQLYDVSGSPAGRQNISARNFNEDDTFNSIDKNFVLQFLSDSIAAGTNSSKWNGKESLGVDQEDDVDLYNFAYLMENAGRPSHDAGDSSHRLFTLITEINNIMNNMFSDNPARLNAYKIEFSDGITSYEHYYGQPEKFEADKAKLMAFMQLPAIPTEVDYNRFALGVLILSQGTYNVEMFNGVVDGTMPVLNLVNKLGQTFINVPSDWASQPAYVFNMNRLAVILMYLAQNNISSEIKTIYDLIDVLNENYAYLPEYAAEIDANMPYGWSNYGDSFAIVDKNAKAIPGATRAILDKITEYFVTVAGESIRNDINSNGTEMEYFQSLVRIYLEDPRFIEVSGLFSIIGSMGGGNESLLLETVGLGGVMNNVRDLSQKFNNNTSIHNIPRSVSEYKAFIGLSGEMHSRFLDYFPLFIIDFVSALNKKGANINLSSFEQEGDETAQTINLSYKLIDTSNNTQVVGYDVYNSIKTSYIKMFLMEETKEILAHISALSSIAFEKDNKYIGSSGYNLKEMFSPFALSISSVQELVAYINSTFVENPDDYLLINDTLTEEELMVLLESYMPESFFTYNIKELLEFEPYLGFLNDDTSNYRNALYSNFSAPYTYLLPYIQALLDISLTEKPGGMSDYDWHQIRGVSQNSLDDLEGYKYSDYNMLSLFDKSWNNGASIDRLIHLLNALVYKQERFLNATWQDSYSGDYSGGYVDGDNYVLNGEEYPITLSLNGEMHMNFTLDYENPENLEVLLDGQKVTQLNGQNVEVFNGYSIIYGPSDNPFTEPAQNYNHINKTAEVWIQGALYIIDYLYPEEPILCYEWGSEVSDINGYDFEITLNTMQYLFTGTNNCYSFINYDADTTTATVNSPTYLYFKQSAEGDWEIYLNPDFSDTPRETINGESIGVGYPEDNWSPYVLLRNGAYSGYLQKYALITGTQGEIVDRVNISAVSLGNASNTALNAKLNEILVALNEDFGFSFRLDQGLDDKLNKVREVLFGEDAPLGGSNTDNLFKLMGVKSFFETFIEKGINDVFSEADITAFEMASELVDQQIKTPLLNVIHMINARLIAYGYNPMEYLDELSVEELLGRLQEVLQIETYDDLVRNLYIQNKIQSNIAPASPYSLFLGENSIGELALVKQMVENPSYMFQMVVGRMSIYIPGIEKYTGTGSNYPTFYLSYYEEEVIDWFNTAFNDKDIFTEEQKDWVIENLTDGNSEPEDGFDFNSETMRRFLLHVDQYEEKAAFQNFISTVQYGVTPLAFSVPYLFSGKQLQSIGLGLLEFGMQILAEVLAGLAG